MLFAKRKRFSFTCEKFSCLRFYIKNLSFSLNLKKFIIKGSVKKVSIRTNFGKAILDIVSSSPFVFEIDSLNIGIVPFSTVDADTSVTSKAVERKSLFTNIVSLFRSSKKSKSENLSSQTIEPSTNEKSSLIRYILPLIRFFDFHVNSVDLCVGDSQFPMRLTLSIANIYVNGSVQFSPSATLSSTLKIQSISLNNHENAFDKQPNVVMTNCWLRLICDVSGRLMINQFTWNIADDAHIRVDKGLYRQLMAVIKAIKPDLIPTTEQNSSSHFTTPLADESRSIQPLTPPEIKETVDTEIAVTKLLGILSRVMMKLPHVAKILLPLVDLDLMNADKSDLRSHNAISMKFGLSARCATTFRDAFCADPRGISLSMELTMFESSFLSCDGIELTVGAEIKETHDRFDTISVAYTHKHTLVSLRPSFLRTVDYMQGMIPRLNSMSVNKPSHNGNKSVMSAMVILLLESQLKVDLRVEELALRCHASNTIISPLLEVSLQAISFSFHLATGQSIENASASKELLMKVGAIEVKSMPVLKAAVMEIIHEAEGLKTESTSSKLPACNDRVFSLCNVEIEGVITKWVKLMFDVSSKTCNITLNYFTMELIVLLLEIYAEEVAEHRRHNTEGISRIGSCDSLSQESHITLPLSSSSNTIPIMPEPMSREEEENILLDKIINMNLQDSGYEDIVNIEDVLIPGMPFTPPPSPPSLSEQSVAIIAPPISVQPVLQPSIAPINSGSLSPSSLSHAAIDSSMSSHCESDVDEIMLTDDENENSDSSEEYRLLPIYLTDLSVRINGVEIQVTGQDTSRSTSYILESFSLVVASKTIASVENHLNPQIGSFLYGDNLPSLLTGMPSIIPTILKPHNEVMTATPFTDTQQMSAEVTSNVLSTINEMSPRLDDGKRFDLDSIPSFTPGSILPLAPPQLKPSSPVGRCLPPLPTRFCVSIPNVPTVGEANKQPRSNCLRNSGIEYSITVDIINISVVGDEGTHVPKSQLPVYIPQIRLTLPPLLFLAVNNSLLPEDKTKVGLSCDDVKYSMRTFNGYHGFIRGGDAMLLITSDNRDVNVIQVLITNLGIHLTYGAIFVIYRSITSIIQLFKSSKIKQLMAKPKLEGTPPVERKKPMKNTDDRRLLSMVRLMVTLSRSSIAIHFSPLHGISVVAEEISFVFPDSPTYPMLYVSNLQISQLRDIQIVATMGTIDKITVFSPEQYSTVSSIRHIDADDSNLNMLRDKINCVSKCKCGKCDSCKRFVTCATCCNHAFRCHECNGYDNRCNLTVDHVPDGVSPFLIIIDSVDITQDRQFTWGDLIEDATLQWKALKYLWKGPKKPVRFPHPDEALLMSVAEHTPFDVNDMNQGYWAQIIIGSVLIRVHDIIPHYSPDKMEYSRVLINGFNGVLTYNRKIHNRSHFLQFIKTMDDAATPVKKGFEDILGLHIHDAYVNSVTIDFGEELPPLLIVEDAFICGTLVFADITRVDQYVSHLPVDLFCSTSYDNFHVDVTRTSIPMKLYQNFIIQAKQFEYFQGDVLYWVKDSFSDAMGEMTPKGTSKSPKLMWYDKIRFSYHGPFTIQVTELFRVNWMTIKEVNNQYEMLQIDIINTDISFQKMGGCILAFDVFSMNMLHFSDTGLYINTPILEVVEGAWKVDLCWCNSKSKNHYVELDEEVCDAVDKYIFYRSNTIEWSLFLGPYENRDFSTSIFLRGEALTPLLELYKGIMSTRQDIPQSKTASIMRVSTIFDFDLQLSNSSLWLFVDDFSESGFNMLAKKNDLKISAYKILPLFLERTGSSDLMNQSAKPDYTNLRYDFNIYSHSNWVFPRIFSKLEDVTINHLSLSERAAFSPDRLHFTPFNDPDKVSAMLIAKITKVGILKGVNPSSSGFDEDIAEMYNEKIRSINGKITEKSEGKIAVFVKGLKLIYSLDVRDAFSVNDFRTIYDDAIAKKDIPVVEQQVLTTIDTSRPFSPIPSVPESGETIAFTPTVPTSPSLSSYSMQRSESRNSSDFMTPFNPISTPPAQVTTPFNARRESMLYESMINGGRPIVVPRHNYLYRSDSSYYSRGIQRDSLRMSTMGYSMTSRGQSEMNRLSAVSSHHLGNDDGNRAMLGRLMSTRSISRLNAGETMQHRRQRREKIYQEMKKREKEAQNGSKGETPSLLTFLLKKAAHNISNDESGVMTFDDESVVRKKGQERKDEKEDFLYDIRFQDSQIHIASIETEASLLLYLYKGTMLVQKKIILQREYNILSVSLQKVDLYLGSKHAQNSPWISSRDISSLTGVNAHIAYQNRGEKEFHRPFKRIVSGFSLTLQTRSQHGVIPMVDTSATSRRDDLVNRLVVNIGSFNISMTGEEFYRVLNVVRYAILVNPTDTTVGDKENKSKMTPLVGITADLFRDIEKKVLSLVKGADVEMIPVLKVKYTLEQVDWTLLTNTREEIAIATLRGLTGEYNFCYDGKSEVKVFLNDLRILNPRASVLDQKFDHPELIFDPITVDRDKDDQSNILEIIGIMSSSFMFDDIPVKIFEHVGINVYPGCHYYILFQLTTEVAHEIYKYFFPEDDNNEETDVNTNMSTVVSPVVNTNLSTNLTRSKLPDNISESSDSDYDDSQSNSGSVNDSIPLSAAAKKLNMMQTRSAGNSNNRQEIVLELSDDSTNVSTEISPAEDIPASRFMSAKVIQASSDAVSGYRGRKNSLTLTDRSSSITATGTSRYRPRGKHDNCVHNFEIFKGNGNCVICRHKVVHVRNLSYQCKICSIIVHRKCLAKLNGKDTTKREKNKITQLVFVEHFRLGNVEMVMSTRGIAPLNLSNFSIVLQHQIYSNQLTTWGKLIKQIKRNYVAEIVKLAPSYVFRGWGLKRGNRSLESTEGRWKSMQSGEEDEDILTDQKKQQLLLGISR